MKAEAIKENGFKETEIGLIPSDWDVVELTENCVAKLIMGQSPPSSTYNKDRKGLPFLQGKAEFGSVSPLPEKWCTKPSRIAEKNDVLISVRAPVGDVNMSPFQCSIGRGLAAIRADKKSLPYFLFYYLQYSKKRIEDEGTGSTFKAINKSVLEHLKIPLPVLSEQQKIAAVLSKIQQSIEQQYKIIQITKELKKSLMNRLFVEGLQDEGQKETEIGLIPKSWNSTKICECYEFTKKPRGFAIKEKTKIPFIPMELISEEERITDKYELRDKFSSGTFVLRGDLVVAKITPSFENGKQGIIGNIPFESTYATTEVWPIHNVKGKSDINYLYYYLKKPSVRADVAGKMEGSTGRQRVPKNVLENLLIPLPSLKEQEEIVSIFISLDKKLSQAKVRKLTLQALFKTMLNQLMTGKVRVKNLDIEVN